MGRHIQEVKNTKERESSGKFRKEVGRGKNNPGGCRMHADEKRRAGDVG